MGKDQVCEALTENHEVHSRAGGKASIPLLRDRGRGRGVYHKGKGGPSTRTGHQWGRPELPRGGIWKQGHSLGSLGRDFPTASGKYWPHYHPKRSSKKPLLWYLLWYGRFRAAPPPHALIFLTSPAWLSSKAQHEGVTVKVPCTFLKLRLQASPVWPLNCIPMLLGIVCSGLPARALLQRRGAPIEIHSSR